MHASMAKVKRYCSPASSGNRSGPRSLIPVGARSSLMAMGLDATDARLLALVQAVSARGSLPDLLLAVGASASRPPSRGVHTPAARRTQTGNDGLVVVGHMTRHRRPARPLVVGAVLA